MAVDIFPQISGEVENWDVLVIGHLRVNEYFGESRESPPRGDPSTCTSVIVRGRNADGSPYVLIVDPTMRWTPTDFYFDLNRRTGLHPEDVTHCYCTHHHLDHYDAFRYFPNAVWMAHREVAEILKRECTAIDAGRIQAVEGEFLPGVFSLPLPGHTPSLHGAAFRCRGKRIVAAGDAVMTKYHFDDGTTDFQPDPIWQERARETIENLKESFDIVIPGHDNLITV